MFLDKKNKVVQPAWDLFSGGNLLGAEQSAVQAMQQQICGMDVSPIPDIMTIKAYYLCRLKRYDEAMKLFASVLEVRPDDAYVQEGYLLALNDSINVTSRGDSSGRNIDANVKGRLILGIGTGRCGSTSLAKLLQRQKNCYASHEHTPRLPWIVNNKRLDFHKRRFHLLLNKYNFVCDVSHWWLPYIEELAQDFNISIVVLKREKEATVNSFYRIKGSGEKGSINHWLDHNGSVWQKNIWDECYPSYNVSDIKEAISLYWEQYYAEVESVRKRESSSIAVFDTNDLSNKNTQYKLLQFCGFSDPVLDKNLHYNKGEVQDGLRMY